VVLIGVTSQPIYLLKTSTPVVLLGATLIISLNKSLKTARFALQHVEVELINLLTGSRTNTEKKGEP
jgi:hypothetical protein